jgi:iron complex outermembrane receptor protein
MANHLSNNSLVDRIFQLAALAAALGAAGAHAQSVESSLRLEEVTVTAQKVSESLQDTPISIAAFNETQLENMGVTSLADIQHSVPSLTIRQFPSSKSELRLFIRGIGNPGPSISSDPSVGVYMDGIYISRTSGLAMEMADLERIEVLRGPQGTLYGRNTTGGAINLITRRPTGELHFKQKLGVSSRDGWLSHTQIDLPETAGVSAKLAYAASKTGGWVKNDGTGPDFGEDKKKALRVDLRWRASDDLTVDYAYDNARIDAGPLYYQTVAAYPGFAYVPAAKHAISRVTPLAPVESSATRIQGHSLIASLDVADALLIKSITAYRTLDESRYQDYSANSVAPRLFANMPLDTEHRQFTQEFQFQGNAIDTRLSYVGGLYYLTEKGEVFGRNLVFNNLLQTRDVTAENSAWAIYGQETYTPQLLDEKLHITLGARYSVDKREIEVSLDNAMNPAASFSGVEGRHSWNNFSTSATVEYDIADSATAYIKYVQGYKTGGFNDSVGLASQVNMPVDEETLTSYEAGLKSQWFNDRVRFNAATYFSDYKDMQLSFAPLGSPSNSTVFNAGTAQIQGVEFELTALLAQGLTLGLNYGYIDADINEVINPNTGVDESAQYRLPNAPQHSYTADLEYIFPATSWGTLSANINYSWRDDIWIATKTSQTPLGPLHGYALLNARLTLSDIPIGASGRFKVAVWGKNLNQEEYAYDIIASFPWSPLTVAFGEPRSYGLEATYEF